MPLSKSVKSQNVHVRMCPSLTLVFDLCKLFVVVLQCLSKFGVLCLNVVHPLELQLQLLSQLQHRYRIWRRQHTATHVNTAQRKITQTRAVKVAQRARNNYIQGPCESECCPGEVSLSKAMNLQQLQEKCSGADPDL